MEQEKLTLAKHLAESEKNAMIKAQELALQLEREKEKIESAIKKME
jgi:hypothetical protein